MKTTKIFQRVVKELKNTQTVIKLIKAGCAFVLFNGGLLFLFTIAMLNGKCSETVVESILNVFIWSLFVLMNILLIIDKPFSKQKRPQSRWQWVTTIANFIVGAGIWITLVIDCLFSLGVKYLVMGYIQVCGIICFIAGLVLLFFIWLAERIFPRLAED